MKTSILLSMSVLMTLAASSAMATPRANRPAETREQRETRDRQGGAAAQTNTRANQVNSVTEHLVKMTRGAVTTNVMREAVQKTLTTREGETVSVLDLALEIQKRDTKYLAEKSNLDAETQKLTERALELAPKFLSLASTISRRTEVNKNEVDAFAKQLSLLKDALNTMNKVELESHLRIIEIAIDKKMKDPELDGNDAYVQALKSEFKEKYQTKLEELLSCVR